MTYLRLWYCSPSSQTQPSASVEDATLGDASDEEQLITEDDLVDPAIVEYEAGSYSPQLIRMFDLPPDTIIFDPEDDTKRLEFARHQIIVTGQLQVCSMSMNWLLIYAQSHC